MPQTYLFPIKYIPSFCHSYWKSQSFFVLPSPCNTVRLSSLDQTSHDSSHKVQTPWHGRYKCLITYLQYTFLSFLSLCLLCMHLTHTPFQELALSRAGSSLFLLFRKKKKVSSSFFQEYCHPLCLLLKSYPSFEFQFEFLFLHKAFF